MMRRREIDPWVDPENRWLRALGYLSRPPRVRVKIVNAKNVAQLLRAMTASSCDNL